MSFSNTNTQTFTATHAKYLASKVAADLKRMQRFYGLPNDSDIQAYETELVEYLKKGYLDAVSYGFQKDGKWIEPTLKYTAKDLNGISALDDDPGRIKPGANISGASFYSYLTHNFSYSQLSTQEKENFKNTLPFKRGGADEPGINGYLSSDKTYSSGGRGLDRSSVKSF